MREMDNCSLAGDFRVSRHAEICQFDRFSSEINFKRARTCNYALPRLGSGQNENTVVKSVQSALSELLTTSATHRTFPRPSTKRGLILIGLELNTNARESFEHC